MAEYQKDYEYRAYPWMREIAKEETKPEPKAEPQETEKSSGLWGKAKNLWNSTKEYCSNFKKKYIDYTVYVWNKHSLNYLKQYK